MTHMCFILNHTCNSAIKTAHLNVATGTTSDILLLTCFHFWQPIYFAADETSFPEDVAEENSRFVGTSENPGHDMTFKVILLIRLLADLMPDLLIILHLLTCMLDPLLCLRLSYPFMKTNNHQTIVL